LSFLTVSLHITRPIRNLVFFGLLTAGIAFGFRLWFDYRQQVAVREITLARLHGEAPAATLDGTHPCILMMLSSSDEKPTLTQCATPTIHKGAVDEFEVDLRYGAFKVRQTDIEVKDYFDVPLTRTYIAQDWVGGNRVQEFGPNTNHPYDIAPLGTRNPYTEMELRLEDGDFLYFKRVSPGTGYADAVYQHIETSTRFYKSTINWNGDGWILRLTDGEEMFFPESYKAKNLAQGAATEIRNSEGDKLQLERDQQRNLTKILTPRGHWIQFTYDNQARIVRAEDDAGSWAKYAYNSGGMLIDVVHSSGQARHYDYSGSLMIAILDGNGHELVRNIYSRNVLMEQVYPNGDVYRFQYVWNPSEWYVIKATITMPDGNKREVEPADFVPEWLRRHAQ
jgi:YD repeat-containing protein